MEQLRQGNFRSLQMNTYGRVTAAVGSVILNVALALILSQGADAATPTTDRPAASPVSYPHQHVVKVHAADPRCGSRLRTRTIVAVILGIIV
jgi:hypothetical protein